MPLTLPAFGAALDFDTVLDRFDGLLFTGSPSNVEPEHYGGPPSANGTLHDPERDATTLPLIRAAIERGVPIFCICRGVQELNVALGGTLHQEVHRVPGRIDHRSNESQPRDVQYGPAHDVTLAEGGFLASLWPSAEVAVNSLHAQGIDRLAPRLAVEATAHLTVRSRPRASATPLRSPWASSGTPSGRSRTIRSRWRSSAPSARPPATAPPPARVPGASESHSPRAAPAPSRRPRIPAPCTQPGSAPRGACRAPPPPARRVPPRAG